MFLLSFILLSIQLVTAEDGLSGWLRYTPPQICSTISCPSLPLPTYIVALNSTTSSPVYTAASELQLGIGAILGKQVTVTHTKQSSPSIIVGTLASYLSIYGNNTSTTIAPLSNDGFYLNIENDQVQILGQNERGALYGAFKYLTLLALGNLTTPITYASSPSLPIRWVNQWDNPDGSIERGYSGPSIFFSDGQVVKDLTRAAQYARLLASIGINGIVVNNVNAKASLLSSANIAGLARLTDVMRPYGVQLGLSLNFASPTSNSTALAPLATFDPLDPSVISWWKTMTSLLYASIPDLAGYLIKANSEGQPGPLTYNRTLSSGANLFARSLSPYGGIVMFRAFVYNQHLSESDWKADRANAAVEFFKELDGLFDDNVIVQIKYGPIDFQVREPVSPLFSHLRKTNAAVELQVSQEYLGQQCHLVYLAPMWKETLSFDLKVEDKESKVSDIISGHRFNRPLGGSAAVVNVGTNTSWLGSHLALSNLYAYGQLAWNPSLSPESILQDWISLTFSSDPEVISIITSLSLQSWPVYESYTGNLGMQTLTDILYTHFGPNPASMDNNGWGQWTRADSFSIGMDRTLSNGTGFSSQYPPSISAMYENITTTPEELLLWFHHVPYRHLLPSSGKTIIQHIYDEHYSGAETAQTFPKRFSKLEGKVDTQRFEEIMYRLTYQAGHAIVWRDVVANFYHNLSGIPDSQGRVGNHPWRVEAESMTLDGYQTVLPDRPEMASNSSAIITTSPSLPGTATTTLTFPSGVYDIAVGFFDLESGRANYTLSLNNKTVGNWIGNSEDFLGKAGSTHLDGHSATRVTFKGIEIEKGDVLRLVGRPDGGERAPVDYVVFLPTGGEAVVD